MWSVFKSKSASRAAAHVVTPIARTATASNTLTIWAKQIDNAREQTEHAITGLAAQFGGIVEKLDSSIAASRQASDLQAREAASDGQQAETYLSEVIRALRELQHGREAFTEELSAIVAYTSELQKMAEEVKMIAFQTNMLSLNAAIEAAHAGESGKGFAVVAHEVSILSKASRDTGQNINQRITAINEALQKIAAHNKSVSGFDQEVIERSEQSIRTVLERQRARVNNLSVAANSSRQENSALKNGIEEALIQLQFQDRVSQILSQITQSMLRPTTDAAADGAIHLEQTHLDRMATTYTTDEQRRIHAGLEAGAAAPQQVTYF